MERAAFTNTSSRTVNTLPRVMRAKIGVYTMPIAIIALPMPGPNAARTAIASKIAGKANKTSIARMMISSSQPP